MLNYYIGNYVFTVLLILIQFANSNTTTSEQVLYNLLENEKEEFYFKDYSGSRKGKEFSLEEIYNVKISPAENPISEFVTAGPTSVNQEGDVEIAAVLTLESFKKPEALTESGQGEFILRRKSGSDNYFIVVINYQTNQPVSIDFMTGAGSNCIIRYLFNDKTGSLKEYIYQESKAKQDWETVSHTLIAEKLYIYDKESLKKERQLDEADKAKVLSASDRLRKLVCNLWHLYSECPVIKFKLEVNESALTNSIDSLMLIYRDTRQTDMNKNPVWNSYKEKAVQVIFRVSREGINIERSTKIYVLNSNTGEFTDQRLKSGIESILYKAISFNDPEYRCLSRRSTLETSLIIENGKIVKFIK